MTSPTDLVQQAIAFFFQTALPEATGKHFADLPDPSVHLGSYAGWDGTPVQTGFGQPVTPAYALRVSPALAVTGGVPSTAGVAAPTAGPVRHLLRVRDVADPTLDDAAEIQRVMADLDSFVALLGSGTAGPDGGGTAGTGGATATGGAAGGGAGAGGAPGGGGQQDAGAVAGTSVPAARAAEWAAAIVASRGALGVNLSTLTAVAPALQNVAPDPESLKEVLQYFFTYTPEGAYYPRWSGSGRDATNPDHLSADYKQRNVVEEQLDREQVYLYGMVPESVLTGGGDLGQGAFREFVIRFQPTGLPDAPFRLATVYTVRARPQGGPFCDFVFFASTAGRGIPVARTVLSRMSTGLISLVGRITGNTEVAPPAGDPSLVTSADSPTPMVQLIATVTGQPVFPPGVIVSGTEDVRVLLVPPGQVAAVAAVPGLIKLALVSPVEAHNDQARAVVNYPGLDAKIAAAAKGGKGVLVGIIDTGIDASHPAFAGRIHSVWDQGLAPVAPLQSPAAAHPGNAAYAAMTAGTEFTGLAAANATDPVGAPGFQPGNGHGTHTAATAAGAEVRDGAGNVVVPAGLAPQATLAIVRGIQVPNGNPVLGVQWIFQKATELGMPCVINMSFGHDDHAHDGSDSMARNMHALCRNAAGAYLPGRILVASAGNERRFNTHQRRQLSANSGSRQIGTVQLPRAAFPLPAGFVPPTTDVLIWVRDPTGSKPAAFPVSVYAYRQTQRRNTYKDVTRAIQLGQQAIIAPPPPALPNPAGVFANHRTQVEVTSVVSDPVNGDHAFRVTFASTSATLPMIDNQWTIALTNNSPQPLDVHAWILGNGTFMEARGDDDHAYLVGTPADSAGIVSVAAVTSRLSWTDSGGNPQTPQEQAKLREITSFSSPGPLRASSTPTAQFPPAVTHEVNAVDVAAPGAFIQSALSQQVSATPGWLATPAFAARVPNGLSQILSGTSMASPVVTGLIANVLAENKLMTFPQVLDLLKAASSIPADSNYQPPAGGGAKPLSVDWGYGLVDASKLK